MIVLAVLAAAFSPPDPNFKYQFALKNPGVMGSPADEDINVLPAWNLSATGKDVVIGIIGNGCTIVHRDILSAQKADLHYNVDDDSQEINPSWDDPNPRYTINHAGIVLGRSNELCTVGVAFEAAFYCMKMKEKSGTHIQTALEKHKGSTHIDYLAEPPVCRESDDAEVRRCAFYRFPEVDQAMINIDRSIVVGSSGVDAVSGGDAAMFAVAGNPRAITVSDTTAGGARTWWANRGASIVVNAPAGGSYVYGSSDGLLPRPPSIGESEEKCEEMSPMGAGAAHVAGVVALMLQANGFRLTYRDVQAIFALTSTKNDPSHESWVKNARGYEYSDVFGFGRVDAELAVKAAGNWTNVNSLLWFPANISDVEIPPTQSGLLNRTVQVEYTEIKSIEWVELHFEFKEVRMLDVLLTSPSGTTAWIVKPGFSDNAHGRLRFVARHFFGEDPHGNWTVSFARSGVGHLKNVTDIEIRIFGAESDDYPVREGRIGGDSTQKLPARDNTQLVITRASEECNTDITLEIKAPQEYNDEYTVSLRNDESHYVYRVATGVKPSQPVTFSVPCLTTQENMTLYAESRAKNISISAPFTLKNPNSVPQILSPAAYDTLWIHNGTLKLDLKIAMNWESLSTDAPAQLAEVGLFNLETDRFVHRVPVFYSNLSGIELHVPAPLSQALLYVMPLWTPRATGCRTLIQPVFALREGDDEPVKFKVPLTDACPVPPGVNDGSFAGPDPKMRKIWIIGVSAFAGLFMAVVLIWHFTCRRKSVDTTGLDMNSRALLTRNEY